MGILSLNLLTFPLWWYTTGMSLMGSWAAGQLHYGLLRSGILLFARHMSEPLYGDYSRSGRIISFFLRVFLLIGKLILFGLRMVIVGGALLLYVIALPFVIVMIAYQLIPL